MGAGCVLALGELGEELAMGRLPFGRVIGGGMAALIGAGQSTPQQRSR